MKPADGQRKWGGSPTHPLTSPRIITVGHGTTPATEFAELLHSAHITELIDVRTAPGSRRNPQFGKDEMQRWLPENNIAYSWEKRLGGFRKSPPDSPDVAIRHPSFRAYASHMRTDQIRTAITEVLARAAALEAPNALAIMCSETVWWRCHRRMIADYLTLIQGIEVQNLMPGPKLTAHSPMPAARIAPTDHGRELIYDVEPDLT
ncbi:MAG TPA: DUF488 domain-containing protein [Actinomycetales bacterium]|nr:DUF488 domain-containing protein [Actinomycetales bacterium]